MCFGSGLDYRITTEFTSSPQANPVDVPSGMATLRGKEELFSRPEKFFKLEYEVNNILQITSFEEPGWRIAIRFTFELLCFVINTPEGEKLYLRLLEHAGNHCLNIALIYWDVFDHKDNMIERYMQETPHADRLINQYLLVKLN